MTVAAAGYLVICVVVGIALIAYSLYQRSQLRASESWVAATAKIAKSELLTMASTDSSEYRIALVYEYEANGARHKGERIGFGTRGYARKKRAEAELERYPVGGTVMAYFNPEDPKEVVLVREAPYSTMYFVLGICMLGLSAGIVLWTTIRAAQ